MLRPRGVGRDKRQVDRALKLRTQLALGLLRGFLEPLMCHRIVPQIDALGLFELVGQEIYQYRVQIVAAQVRVAVGAEHLEDVVADIEDRNIERSAAEVEDRNLLVLFLLQPVRQCRGGGLIDYPLDLKPGDFAGVLGRLTLRVVEVSRDGDDRAGDRLAQVILGGLLQILQNHRRNLRWSVFLAPDVDLNQFIGGPGDFVGDYLLFRRDFMVSPAHETLYGKHGVLRVCDLLMPCNLAHEPFALIGETNHRRSQPRAR